jgi:hypothetical protein
MTLITYEPKKFSAARLEIIEKANEIIGLYAAEGYDLTLRQLYYQFVARDLIPNKQSEYKRLGAIISEARRAGLVSWDAIVDRTRNLRSLNTWDSPAQIIWPPLRSSSATTAGLTSRTTWRCGSRRTR